MKNFVQPGRSIDIVAPAAVTSGQVVVVGSLVGVANCDAAIGAQVAVDVEGVFSLAKTPGDSITQGAPVKVNAAGVVDAGGTKTIGYSVAAAGAGTNAVNVRLVPSVA